MILKKTITLLLATFFLLHGSVSIATTDDNQQVEDSVIRNSDVPEIASSTESGIATDEHLISNATVLTPSEPRDMSPLGMYLAADVIVKGVIIVLIFGSVLTWSVFLFKWTQMTYANAQIKRIIRLWEEIDRFSDLKSDSKTPNIGRLLVHEVSNELQRSSIKDEAMTFRIEHRIRRLVLRYVQHLRGGLSILATVGSVAPFIGLFGTVWGIMNSFIDITRAETTNLMVVAPGIAEALFATAFGLVAAIPAVMIYNYLQRKLVALQTQITFAASSLLLMVSRDVGQSEEAQNNSSSVV